MSLHLLPAILLEHMDSEDKIYSINNSLKIP